MTLPTTHTPACPRCRYDLSGTVSASSGQTEGLCPECGLTFPWDDVLNPEKNVPVWFAENLDQPVRRTVILTWFRAMAPWQFWNSIRMAFPMRPKRLAVFLLVCMTALHLSAAFWPIVLLLDEHGIVSLVTREYTRTLAIGYILWPMPLPDWAADKLYNLLGSRALIQRPFRFPDAWELLTAIAILGMAIGPLVLTETRARLKIRWSHIVRVWIYTLPAFILVIPIHDFAATLAIACDSPRWSAPGVGLVTRPIWFIASYVRPLHRVVPMELCAITISLAIAAVCWRLALGRYLKAPRALWITAMSLLISTLAGVNAALIFDTHTIVWTWIHRR